MEQRMFLSPFYLSDLEAMITKALRETMPKFIKNESSTFDDMEMLTRKEAYEFLKVGPTKFNDLRRKGLVVPIREGRRTYYLKKQLLEYRMSLMVQDEKSSAVYSKQNGVEGRSVC